MKNILLLTILLIAINSMSHAKTCNQFKNWKEAKAYFDAKKTGYKGMDRNHDGKPCESLWKKDQKKGKQTVQIMIYKYGHPNGIGRSFSSMKKCEKEKKRLTKANAGTDYSYKCKEK